MRFARGNGVLGNKGIWRLARRAMLPVVSVVLAVCGGAGVASAQPLPADADSKHGSPPTAYRVVHLGPGSIASYPHINAKGEVAFSLVSGGRTTGFFYNGAVVRNIGSLGGGNVYAFGLNDGGQIAGTSLNGSGIEQAFVWSAGGGMLGLTTETGSGRSCGLAINRHGVLTGSLSRALDDAARPLRWSAASGAEDLGYAPGLPWPSTGRVLNDAGLIAGVATIDDEQTHVFVWTRASGMVDIDTLGSVESSPVAVGAGGEVAGNRLASSDDGGDRPFLWTAAGGMVDLGTGRGSTAWVNAMTPGLHIAGGIGYADGHQRAMSWTRRGGMRELGTLGGRTSVARVVNDRGQIAGFAENKAGAMRAFVWSAANGMQDLNRLLRHAPPGLVLEHAMAINDSGAIVASSNAGLVLLKPDDGRKHGPALGPLLAPSTVKAGMPLQAALSFVDGDSAGTRSVDWSWGDGSGGAARKLEEGGAGKASASHSYEAPGIYSVTATVIGRDGSSTVASRDVVVTPAMGAALAGAGALLSPAGALQQRPPHAAKAQVAKAHMAKAHFSLLTPLATAAGMQGMPAMLRFDLPGMDFRSQALRPLGRQDGLQVFEGSGTIGGAGHYMFKLSAAPSIASGEPGRLLLTIWQADAAGKAGAIVYDNTSTFSAAEAGRLVEGNIIVQ